MTTQTISAASKALKDISEEDLQTRVVTKFKDIVKSLKAAGVLPRQRVDGGTSEVEGGAAPREKLLKKANKQSRQRGKLDMRLKKRELLPENSEYRKKKYDTAFAVTLMSEDDDEMDDGKPTGRYVSRPPAYRTTELSDLFDAIDAVDPPQNSKYKVRIKGEIIDNPPIQTPLAENRARRWMVRAEWLAENKQYDVNTRIMENGVERGDSEDPEELELKRKRVQVEKAGIKAAKKLKVSAGDSKKIKVTKKANTNGRKSGKGKERAREDDGGDAEKEVFTSAIDPELEDDDLYLSS